MLGSEEIGYPRLLRLDPALTSPLTPDEWKLLHQTMDRVDAARNNVPLAPPNLERIKRAALETYRSQGIEVAEKELEHALAAAMAVAAADVVGADAAVDGLIPQSKGPFRALCVSAGRPAYGERLGLAVTLTTSASSARSTLAASSAFRRSIGKNN